MKKYRTKQEEFWAGLFGDEYIHRNNNESLLAGKINMFSTILKNAGVVESCLELGANIGLNLQAIKSLLPMSEISAIEINEKAIKELEKIKDLEIFQGSILDFNREKQWDLTFTSGVLIHINPENLNQAYDVLYKHSRRYICIAEYYNPSPVQVSYRENKGYLFKRDFAGEILDRYPDLKLLSYGFLYHRDNNFPMGDANWFLLEK